MYLIVLNNNSYSDDLQIYGPVGTLPTRDTLLEMFGEFSCGDHDNQTYSVIDCSVGKEVGSITVYESGDTFSHGCLE